MRNKSDPASRKVEKVSVAADEAVSAVAVGMAIREVFKVVQSKVRKRNKPIFVFYLINIP